MAEKTAIQSTNYRDEAFLEGARAAWEARLAEARRDPAAAAWAERNAEILLKRLNDRAS